jgi:hypothetical protein
MKFLIPALCFLFSGLAVCAKDKTFSVPEGQKPVHILDDQKQVLLVTDKTVSVIGKTPATVITGAGQINDALVSGAELWLATNDGLKVFGGKDFKAGKQYFSGKVINAIGKDVYNRVWVATAQDGVYLQVARDSFEQKLNISTVYSLVCTPDSNVWIGTNIGMYHVSATDFNMQRYAEEGYSGHELPDNIVERLYKDEGSNVWVLMPDNISFKSSSNYAGEIPSFGFVGEQRNSIAAIVPLQQKSYLFITGKGVVLLPSSSLKEESHQHNSEIFAAHDTKAFALTGTQLGSPEPLKNSPVVFAEKSGGDVYFLTAAGGWKVKEKQLLQLMMKR